jgi:hypothetical protein
MGLLVGGLLGLVLSVLFEDSLKATFSRTRRRLRGRRSPAPAWVQRPTFELGPLRTSHLVLEGDGTAEIPEDMIHLIVDNEFVELPPDVAARRDEIAAEQEALKAQGRTFSWNGACYAIARFTSSRRPDDEAPEIFMRLVHSDYYTFLATQELDRPTPEGATLRTRYLEGVDPLDVEPFMASSFGVNVAVVTKDGKLVVSQRSEHLPISAGLWSSSANEALSRTIDSAGRSVPSFHDVARRGLREELSLEEGEYDLMLLTFCVDVATNQWGATFIARLHRLTSDQLEARWSRGTPDGWEHDRHCLVRFRPSDVIDFILAPERISRWTATGPALFYFALVNEFGRGPVERAVVQRTAGAGRRRSRLRTPALLGRARTNG